MPIRQPALDAIYNAYEPDMRIAGPVQRPRAHDCDADVLHFGDSEFK